MPDESLQGEVSTTPEAMFMDPAAVTVSFDLQSNMAVADFGVGPGQFALIMAEVILPEGRLTAIDVQQTKLEHLTARSSAEGLNNINIVRADLEVLGGTGLPDASQDFVLIANVLYESKQKEKILAEAMRVLKSGGRLCVIDWQKGLAGFGPAEGLRVDESSMRTMIEAGGFVYYGSVTTDPFHYGLMYQKQ